VQLDLRDLGRGESFTIIAAEAEAMTDLTGSSDAAAAAPVIANVTARLIAVRRSFGGSEESCRLVS
jgi:hypothetical protein